MFASETFWEYFLVLLLLAVFVGLAFIPKRKKKTKSAAGKDA